MIVEEYIDNQLKEQVRFNVIYHPKDEIIIGESYYEPLNIIIKNTGDSEIKIKEFLVEFPEGVTFKLKNKVNWTGTFLTLDKVQETFSNIR